MTDVVDRLAVAMNAHDLNVVAQLIHPDYRSEQPAHPGRAFTGRAQMLANWEAMLAGIPDFCAEICRSVHDGDTAWTEWRWSGTRSDGQAFEMRGVTAAACSKLSRAGLAASLSALAAANTTAGLSAVGPRGPNSGAARLR